MANDVKLSVDSQLGKIIEDLQSIREHQTKVNESMKEGADVVGESIKKNSDNSKNMLNDLKGMGQRVSDQLKRDFMSLASVSAIQDSLKLTNNFKGNIKESIALGDTIRKLGRSFNIAGKDFTSFQSKMIKGLGEIGLASEVGARSMEGLVDTPVRGQDALLEYAKLSGQLTSLSDSRGEEDVVSKGIANVILAKGGDVNNKGEIAKVAEDLRRVFVQTGKSPAETLTNMEQLFTNMSTDFRKGISTRGLSNLAAAGQVAGPNSTKFLEEMLGMSSIQRKALDAQGFGNIFNEDGIDIDKFRSSAGGVLGRIGNDPEMAAQTLGISEEAAKGFIRLYESLDKVKKAQDGIRNATGSVTEQYKESMGFAEAFAANLNRVKKIFATPLSMLSQGGANLLGASADSDAGSAATILGGGALAAVLAGGGLKGIGKGLGKGALGGIGGSLVKGQIASAITGQDVQPVYVTNASEIGGGMGAMGGIGGAGKLAGAARMVGGVGAAAGVGVAIGKLIEPLVTDALNKNTTTKTSEGFEGNALERLFFKMDKLFGGDASSSFIKNQKVMVELNKRDLKESKQPTRGSSF